MVLRCSVGIGFGSRNLRRTSKSSFLCRFLQFRPNFVYDPGWNENKPLPAVQGRRRIVPLLTYSVDPIDFRYLGRIGFGELRLGWSLLPDTFLLGYYAS